MVDIRLITILPAAPIPGVQPPTTPQNTGGGTGSISNIAPGTTLSGFIINRDALGNPILRTDTNDVVFASDVFLKIGAEVVIRVQQQAGQILAKLISVNGTSPEIAQTQSAFANEPGVVIGGRLGNASAEVASSKTTPADTQASSPLDFVISGRVVSSSAPASLPNSAQVNFKLLGVSASAAAATIESPLTAANATSYAVYTKNTGTLVSDVGSVLTQTATTPSNVPINKLSESVSTPAAVIATENNAIAFTSPQIGQQLFGQIIASSPSQLLLKTPIGIIELDKTSPLPSGSKVNLEIASIVTPQALQTASLLSLQAPITELATRWNSLQNVFTLLLGSNAAATEGNNPITSALLPSLLNANIFTQLFNQQRQLPSAQSLIVAINNFAAALKTGDIRSWLGRNASKWLEENGHGALLKKLEGEFLLLSRQYAGAQAGEWQALFYPLAAYGEIQQLRMFIKRDKPDKNKQERSKKSDDTRFIVEVDMSQMGELQIDGFVRRNTGEKVQFDMIIRSLQPLTTEFQHEILAIYNRMGEATGYLGQLSFQHVRDFPVNPMEEVVKQHISNVLA